MRIFTLPEIVFNVAMFIPLLIALAVGIATVLHVILTGRRIDFAVLKRTAAAAASCAPVAILLRNHSWIAPLGVALLVSSLLLFLKRRTGTPRARLASASWISLLVQVGVAAMAMDQTFIGSILLGSGAAPAVWRASQEGLWARPRAATLALAAAVVMMFAALLDNNWIYRIVHTPQARWDAVAGDPAAALSDAERHRAVILIPDAGRAIRPRPSVHSSQLPAETFHGVYWLLQPPDNVPPERAFTTRGNPRQETFHSVGHANLTMEARQNLARTLDLSTCGAVDVTVDNEEDAILLEVVLVNTKDGSQPVLSLGERRAGAGVHSLRFPIQAAPAQSFDEIGIRFKRMTPPYDRSVRASVVQFAFVSR